MSALTPRVVKEFCKLCDWAYEVWVTHRVLFDDNPDINLMMQGKSAHLLERLSIITHEYSLHQLIKLHDPAVQVGRVNLSLEYVVNYGGWDQKTISILRPLHDTLIKELASRIRPARNRCLSHNDLKTVLDDSSLGKFDKDADCRYFEALQEFVNVIHDKSIGGPYPFNEIAKNDARFLRGVLLRA